MITLKNYHLGKLLQKLLTNSYTNHDLLSFVDLSEKIAIGYLRFLQSNNKKITSTNGFKSLELSNIAIDCIAPIFRRNERHEFVELQKFFSHHFGNGNGADDLILFMELKALIIQSVKQGLAIIFKERDPEGARLFRNIRSAIQNSDDLIISENLSRVYVFSTINLNDPDLFRKFVGKEIDIHHPLVREKLRCDLPLIPIPDLKNYFLAKYSPYSNIPTMIRNLLTIVNEKDELANYLSMDEIVGVAKYFKRREVPISDFTEQALVEETPEDVYDARQLNQIRLKITNRISELIDEKYGFRQKFSADVLWAFRRALIHFSENYIDGRKKISHYQLLKYSLPELTLKEYRETYRNAFEYLVKSIRQEIKTEIANFL